MKFKEIIPAEDRLSAELSNLKGGNQSGSLCGIGAHIDNASFCGVGILIKSNKD